jgi:hypothetical protein
MDIIRGGAAAPDHGVVIVLAVVLGGSSALTRIRATSSPNLDVPVIYIAQPYAGMDAAQMEGFLTYRYEIQFLYVSGIEHIESKSVPGLALIKLQFYPGTDMANAMAETINQIQRAQRFMPKGSVPPFVIRFDAGSVPVGNSGLFEREPLPDRTPGFRGEPDPSDVLVDARDLGPAPFGGSERSIVIHLDPGAPPGPQHVADRSRGCPPQHQHDEPLGQRTHRNVHAHRVAEFHGLRHQGARATCPSAWRTSPRLHAATWQRRGRRRNRARIRARRRPPAPVYIPVAKRAGVLDARGRQPPEGEPSALPGRRTPGRQDRLRIRPVLLRHSAPIHNLAVEG